MVDGSAAGEYETGYVLIANLTANFLPRLSQLETDSNNIADLEPASWKIRPNGSAILGKIKTASRRSCGGSMSQVERSIGRTVDLRQWLKTMSPMRGSHMLQDLTTTPDGTAQVV